MEARKKTDSAAKNMDTVKEAVVLEDTQAVKAETSKEETKAEKKKPTPRKPAARKTAAKTTASKATASKTTTTKTAAAKTAAKKETEISLYLQFGGKEVSGAALVEEAKKAYAALGGQTEEIQSIAVYVKPEEGVAYYTVNGTGSDEYKIVL